MNNKVPRCVRFNSQVLVYLIPHFLDFIPIKHILWYSDTHYRAFAIDYTKTENI